MMLDRAITLVAHYGIAWNCMEFSAMKSQAK